MEKLASESISGISSVLSQTIDGELSIACVDDDAIHTLNKTYRGKDKPTNVLSFPSDPPLLGDIVLAYGVIKQESDTRRIAFEDHVTHLIIHGFLHLLGYDHQNDEDAAGMEHLEIEALKKLGIDNPYEIHDR